MAYTEYFHSFRRRIQTLSVDGIHSDVKCTLDIRTIVYKCISNVCIVIHHNKFHVSTESVLVVIFRFFFSQLCIYRKKLTAIRQPGNIYSSVNL